MAYFDGDGNGYGHNIWKFCATTGSFDGTVFHILVREHLQTN